MKFQNTKGKYKGEDKSVRYIFNFKLSDYLIKNGATVLGAGIGHKDGAPFIVFAVNDTFKESISKYHKEVV